MEDETLLYKFLAAYFSGEASPAGTEAIDKWRNESSENEALFHTLRKQWEIVKINTSSYVFPDKSAIWNKIQHTIF